MHDPYKSCRGCPRRLTNGENCHTKDYCPGWGYREEEKANRYAKTNSEIAGTPGISSYQKRLIYRNVFQKKGGRKP